MHRTAKILGNLNNFRTLPVKSFVIRILQAQFEIRPFIFRNLREKGTRGEIPQSLFD